MNKASPILTIPCGWCVRKPTGVADMARQGVSRVSRRTRSERLVSARSGCQALELAVSSTAVSSVQRAGPAGAGPRIEGCMVGGTLSGNRRHSTERPENVRFPSLGRERVIRQLEQTLEELGRTIRYAGRSLRKSPRFAGGTVATLALCVGAALTIFAVVDGVLLRPLPFPHAADLIAISNSYPNAGVPDDGCSLVNYYERRGRL